MVLRLLDESEASGTSSGVAVMLLVVTGPCLSTSGPCLLILLMKSIASKT